MSHQTREVKISVRFVKVNGVKQGVLTVQFPIEEGGGIPTDFVQPEVFLLEEALTSDWGHLSLEEGYQSRTKYYDLPPKEEVSAEDFMRTKERGVLAILNGVVEDNRLPEGWENTYSI